MTTLSSMTPEIKFHHFYPLLERRELLHLSQTNKAFHEELTDRKNCRKLFLNQYPYLKDVYKIFYKHFLQVESLNFWRIALYRRDVPIDVPFSVFIRLIPNIQRELEIEIEKPLYLGKQQNILENRLKEIEYEPSTAYSHFCKYFHHIMASSIGYHLAKRDVVVLSKIDKNLSIGQFKCIIQQCSRKIRSEIWDTLHYTFPLDGNQTLDEQSKKELFSQTVAEITSALIKRETGLSTYYLENAKYVGQIFLTSSIG